MWHPFRLIFLNVLLKTKLAVSLVHSVSVCISTSMITRMIRDCGLVNVHHHFKVRPSPGSVHAANDIRRIITSSANTVFAYKLF
jgi:hypothetical protein